MQPVIYCAIFMCLVLSEGWLHEPRATHGIDTAYVICTGNCTQLQEAISTELRIPKVIVWTANLGTATDLPLYTRHIIEHGRSDHLQIPNRAALGCLLSHSEIWDQVALSGKTTAVFEEDATVGPESLDVLQTLLTDLGNRNYSVLMLTSGHLNNGGSWRHTR